MIETIINLLTDSPTWSLSAAERKRLSDYLQQVKATLQTAQAKGTKDEVKTS